MAKPLLSDQLWVIIEPLLPHGPPSSPGRTAAGGRSQGADRHPLRPQDRHSLGGNRSRAEGDNRIVKGPG